jgi:hypothetical protein
MVEAGLTALKWLAELQRGERDHFVPIGNCGFRRGSQEKPRFDQQPIEAEAMCSACLVAYLLSGDQQWYFEARRVFEWFLGTNDLGLPLYDSVTGGCRDGLHADRRNQNQGAESTLAFLLALVGITAGQNLLGPGPEASSVEIPSGALAGVAAGPSAGSDGDGWGSDSQDAVAIQPKYNGHGRMV